jgi:predicted RNA-binding protein with PIN domain
MDIVIDGYNLIGSESGLSGALEHKRNWLIKQLVRYQEIKKFNLTVVFDGWRSGQAHEAAERAGGVAVVYSRLGEKADAVIVRIARAQSSGAVIVTSDREIRSAVEKLGAVTVSAAEFNQILRSLDGSYCSDDDDDQSDFRTAKKGNANRLSKSERRHNDKLKKLKL